jgi:hypothetical protein
MTNATKERTMSETEDTPTEIEFEQDMDGGGNPLARYVILSTEGDDVLGIVYDRSLAAEICRRYNAHDELTSAISDMDAG